MDQRLDLKEYKRQYYLKNKEKHKAYMKAYQSKNKERLAEYARENPKSTEYLRKYTQSTRGMFTRIKTRAKRKGIEFSIDLSDIVVPQTCPILGIKLEFRKEIGSKKADDCAPSLDRIDNSKGYIKGNVRVISNRANRYKSDNTLETLEALVRYMKGEI